jgi:hypothetical protein
MIKKDPNTNLLNHGWLLRISAAILMDFFVPRLEGKEGLRLPQELGFQGVTRLFPQ